MNVLSGKAVQKHFIEEWEVPSHLFERQERYKVGQAKELSAMTSDSDHSSLLPENFTLGNPLDRTAPGSGLQTTSDDADLCLRRAMQLRLVDVKKWRTLC